MAVYTEVPDDELNDFIDTYDIGAVTSCKGIAEGVENTNYLLKTEQDDFILTLYEKRVKREDLPFFIGLMEHLAANNIACPTPIKDREGRVLRELAGRPCALISFLQGMWVRRPLPNHCAELGRAMAGMHLAALDFDGTRKNSLSVSDWRPLFEQSKSGADGVHNGLADEIEDELSRLEADWPSGLPQGIIHADLFPNNVFFIGDHLSGIIDYYFACTDALVYDIAICLNAWCFEPDGAFNTTKARALLSAYQAVRPLSKPEFDALPLMARGASLRFLLTRLYDWLNVPAGAMVKPHDPLEYLRKLRFHKHIKSASEYGLDQ
jgi:homoserine kinase type II